MRLGGHRHADGVDAVEHVPVIGERLRAVLRRDLGRASRLGVDDADQLDVVHRRQQPRVRRAEMAHADDRNPHSARPTIVMPASFAEAMSASFSNINAFPASTDSALAPATRIAWIVARPMTGTSKRMS